MLAVLRRPRCLQPLSGGSRRAQLGPEGCGWWARGGGEGTQEALGQLVAAPCSRPFSAGTITAPGRGTARWLLSCRCLRSRGGAGCSGLSPWGTAGQGAPRQGPRPSASPAPVERNRLAVSTEPCLREPAGGGLLGTAPVPTRLWSSCAGEKRREMGFFPAPVAPPRSLPRSVPLPGAVGTAACPGWRNTGRMSAAPR